MIESAGMTLRRGDAARQGDARHQARERHGDRRARREGGGQARRLRLAVLDRPKDLDGGSADHPGQDGRVGADGRHDVLLPGAAAPAHRGAGLERGRLLHGEGAASRPARRARGAHGEPSGLLTREPEGRRRARSAASASRGMPGEAQGTGGEALRAHCPRSRTQGGSRSVCERPSEGDEGRAGRPSRSDRSGRGGASSIAGVDGSGRSGPTRTTGGAPRRRSVFEDGERLAESKEPLVIRTDGRATKAREPLLRKREAAPRVRREVAGRSSRGAEHAERGARQTEGGARRNVRGATQTESRTAENLENFRRFLRRTGDADRERGRRRMPTTKKSRRDARPEPPALLAGGPRALHEGGNLLGGREPGLPPLLRRARRRARNPEVPALARDARSLYLNMFGYDDEELNAECMRCACDASVTTVITLDKSQAGGKHEKAILDSDAAQGPCRVQHARRPRAVGDAPDHAHEGRRPRRARRLRGVDELERLGEGTFVVKGRPGGPGYKAQNNTLAVFTDPDTIARFTAELVAEHLAARGPGLSRGSRVRRS